MNYKLKSKIKFILFIIIFLNNTVIFAQSFERNETILAYLYQFPNHITWKNEKNLKDFHFLLITGNQDLIKTFEKVSKSLKIKNKPIKLSIATNPNIDYSSVRAIFVSSDKLDLYLKIFDKIEGKEILLICDSYNDQRFVMINMYDSETKKLVFEINKANIINQGLEISDEILLLGGNLIDVAELYRNSQQSLRSIEKTLAKYENTLDSLHTQMSHVYSKFKNQKQEINEQNELIKNQKQELKSQLLEINKQKKLVKEQISILNSQKDSIQKQSVQLSSTQYQLNKQKREIQKGKETLNKQQSELQRMDSEIQEEIKILGKQNITISRQRQILILFIIVILLIIILTFLIFRAYNNNRKKNDILKAQKVEIEKINKELKSSNEELYQKNEEISVTLDKLKETQNQLVQSEKMASLGVLTAGIAHEINNPINFVYTGVNSLKKDFNDISHVLKEINNLSPETDNPKDFILKINRLKKEFYFTEAYEAIQKTIEHIELGAVRTADIVRGLRNFSRMEKEEWQFVDVHSNINDVLILLKNKYKHHIKIVKDFDLSIPRIECLSGKINQVILNILSNAIDSIQENGEIFITTKLVYNFVSISIKDTGAGMEDKVKSKIFDPFFTTKEVGKGVGLGLSITYGIIQEHNAEIDVISKKAEGTEFIIKLPIKQNT